MEDEHKFYLIKRFPAYLQKEILVLNIPSTYLRNDPFLRKLILERLEQKGINDLKK